MTSTISLDQMPNLVLAKILEKSDFLDVLSLRKTCRHLHHFIDDLCPEKNLQEVKISIFSDSLKLELIFPDSQNLSIEYERFQGTSCLVRWSKSRSISKSRSKTILPDADVFNVASGDLKILLKLQKSKLIFFKISFRMETDIEDSEFFIRILKNRPRPLQMEFLDLEVTEQTQLLQTLPHVDPEFISNLKIDKYLLKDQILKIDKLIKLENWKKLKGSINIGLNSGKIRDFTQFSDIYVKFPMVEVQDLVFLKEQFLSSAHINCVYLQVVTPFDLPELLGVFGPTVDDRNYMGSHRKRWFFKCYSNPEEILSIDFTARCIQFQRVEEQDLDINFIDFVI